MEEYELYYIHLGLCSELAIPCRPFICPAFATLETLGEIS